MKTGIIDHIVITDIEDKRAEAIGYLIRSENGFTGYMDNNEHVMAIDRDDAENLILKGIRFKYVRKGNDRDN